MAVLISTKVKGQTQEGYDGVLTAVRELVKKAPDSLCIVRTLLKMGG